MPRKTELLEELDWIADQAPTMDDDDISLRIGNVTAELRVLLNIPADYGNGREERPDEDSVSISEASWAVAEYRKAVDTYQPTNEQDSRVNPKLNLQAACAGEILADRIERILQGGES